MTRSVAQLMGWALAFNLMGWAQAAIPPAPSEEARAVIQRFREIAADLHDPADQAAMARLIAAFTARGTVSRNPQDAWVLLTFNRNARVGFKTSRGRAGPRCEARKARGGRRSRSTTPTTSNAAGRRRWAQPIVGQVVAAAGPVAVVAPPCRTTEGTPASSRLGHGARARATRLARGFETNSKLTAVEINAVRFLSAPSLVQEAILLHELEHLKHAPATDQAFDDLTPLATAPAQHRDQAPLAEAAHRMQAIVRILVEDESQAYRREILHVARGVQAAGGLARYLQTLPDAQRRIAQPYYAQHVAPLIDDEYRIDERRLRQELIFLRSFPRRYRRYYEAALAWEALQGHVEIRRSLDGTLRPARLLAPTAFLAWLVP